MVNRRGDFKKGAIGRRLKVNIRQVLKNTAIFLLLEHPVGDIGHRYHKRREIQLEIIHCNAFQPGKERGPVPPCELQFTHLPGSAV